MIKFFDKIDEFTGVKSFNSTFFTLQGFYVFNENLNNAFEANSALFSLQYAEDEAGRGNVSIIVMSIFKKPKQHKFADSHNWQNLFFIADGERFSLSEVKDSHWYDNISESVIYNLPINVLQKIGNAKSVKYSLRGEKITEEGILLNDHIQIFKAFETSCFIDKVEGNNIIKEITQRRIKLFVGKDEATIINLLKTEGRFGVEKFLFERKHSKVDIKQESKDFEKYLEEHSGDDDFDIANFNKNQPKDESEEFYPKFLLTKDVIELIIDIYDLKNEVKITEGNESIADYIMSKYNKLSEIEKEKKIKTEEINNAIIAIITSLILMTFFYFVGWPILAGICLVAFIFNIVTLIYKKNKKYLIPDKYPVSKDPNK